MEGISIFDDGVKIMGFGREPPPSVIPPKTDSVFEHKLREDNSYILGWPVTLPDGNTQNVYVRLDSQWISTNLHQFAYRIFGLVMIISAFVTGGAMIALWPLVLRPMLALKLRLGQTDFHELNIDPDGTTINRKDEMGDLYRETQNMADRVGQSFTATRKTQDALESQVAERTKDLKSINGELFQQAEKALYAENRFRSFAEVSSDWLWETDENLRFTYFSDKFEDVTGVKPSEMLGKTREEVGAPGADPEELAELLSSLENRQGFRNFIHRRKKSDGDDQPHLSGPV